jgi:hypothetical protein
LVAPRLRVFCTLTLLLAGGVACGCGAKSAAPPATPAETAVPADAEAIRAIDFNQVATFQTLLRQTGGQLEARAVLYADVTGDGREEAIVPVTSGGSLGNLAYQVYTLGRGAAAPILTATRDAGTAGGLVLSVEGGRLIRTAAKYGPDDPLCCPSVLVKSYYRWDGANLQVEREEELPASPSQKTKD